MRSRSSSDSCGRNYPKHKPGRTYQGVTAECLRDLASKLSQLLPGVSRPTTAQVAEAVKAATRSKRCSYHDLVGSAQHTPADGGDLKPFVDTATVYVVHAWSSPFRATLDCMLKHAEEEPAAVFWLDLLADNRHKGTQRPSEAWLRGSMRGRIAAIGSMLVCLPAHDQPGPLARSWCLWEICVGLAGRNIRVQVSMPSGATTLLQKALYHDFEGTVASWVQPRVSAATASDSSMRARLEAAMSHLALEDTVGSHTTNQQLDSLLFDHMRFFLLNTAITGVQAADDNGGLAAVCSNVPGLLVSLGNMLCDFGDCHKAIGFYQRALTALPEGHVKRAPAHRALGIAHHRLGDLQAALCHYNKWLAVTADAPEAVITPTQRSSIYMCLGAIHEATGETRDVSSAIKVYRAALQIEEKVEPRDIPRLGTTFHSIARVSAAAGRHVDALVHYRKAAELPFEEAVSLRGVAAAHAALGDTGAAVEAYTRVVELQTVSHGAASCEVATALEDVISVLESCGKYHQALKLHQRCLSIRLAVYGHEHPFTAIAYNNKAKAHTMTQDYGAALECYRVSLDIKLATVGELDLETAVTYSNMALTHRKQGNLAKAEELFQKSIDIKTVLLGPSHPETAAGYRYLAFVHLDANRPDRALHFLQLALKICTTALGPNHAHTAMTLNHIAGAYGRAGDWRRESEHLHQVRRIEASAMGMVAVA